MMNRRDFGGHQRVAFVLMMSLAGCGGASAGGPEDVEGTGGSGGGIVPPSCEAGAHLEDDVCRAHIAEWTTSTALPQAVDHHVTFVVEEGETGHLFVMGGFDGTNVVDTVLRAPLTGGTVGTWEALTPLPEAMSGQGVASYVDGDRWLVLTGGRRAGFAISATTDVAMVSNGGNAIVWSAGPPMNVSRFHHTTEVRDGVIYAIGGLTGDGTNNTDDVARLTAIDGSWEAETPLPQPRSHHCSLVHEDRLYVIGGLTGNPAGAHTSHRDVLGAEIDASGRLGSWTTMGEDLPATLATHACFARLGFVYVVGGVVGGDTISEQVWRAPLDASGGLGAWEAQQALPGARGHVHQVPVHQGYIYSAGGRRGQSLTDVFVGRME